MLDEVGWQEPTEAVSARRQRKAGNTDLMLTQLAKHFRVGGPRLAVTFCNAYLSAVSRSLSMQPRVAKHVRVRGPWLVGIHVCHVPATVPRHASMPPQLASTSGRRSAWAIALSVLHHRCAQSPCPFRSTY